MSQPSTKPRIPNFSSGPCAKRPGYDVAKLDLSALGRSHRSALGKKLLGACCTETARILGLPEGYRVAVVPASDTGAVEMAMWSLLGPRGVDMLAWESFGSGWVTDVMKQLKLPNARKLEAGYGEIVDLSQVNFDHDVVFTWNGTTSGVRVPDGDWIPEGRAGLTICDATSAVFAMALPWDKLDVITYSWQKVLGGEGAHGMLILGPRAVELCALGLPAGLGEPPFDGVENRLSQALYAIPAVKCVEFGAGAAVSRLRGSAHNDAFYYDEAGRVRTRTNRHGGVLGGMTTGMPLLLTCHIKPTPSIALPQESVNLQTRESARLCVPGRHDPCAALRAVPCVEAAAAIALLDLYQEGLIDGIG